MIAGQAMVRLTVTVPKQPFESVALIVSDWLLARVVGVPDKSPEVDRVIPVGSVPALSVKVIEPTPPL